MNKKKKFLFISMLIVVIIIGVLSLIGLALGESWSYYLTCFLALFSVCVSVYNIIKIRKISKKTQLDNVEDNSCDSSVQDKK